MYAILSSFLFLISLTLVPSAIMAVEITFSDPYLIETDPGPLFPADSIIDASIRISVVKSCLGPNYDLVLTHNYTYGGCMINRVDHNGNLIDSASLYVRHIDLAGDGSQTYSFKAATWSAPYYYILTLFEDKIYYTRITEDLSLVDAQPVEYIDGPHRLFADGDYLWATCEAAPGEYIINRYQIPSQVPDFDDIAIPPQVFYADHVVANNGLWLCEPALSYTRFYPSHISSEGQLTILDSVDNETTGQYIPSYSLCLIPYDSNTAYFCWFEQPDSGNYQLQYIKISPTSPSTTESEPLDLDSLSSDVGFRLKGFQEIDGELSFVAQYRISFSNNPVAFIKFDPILEEITRSGIISNTDGYGEPREFVAHDSVLLMFNIINDNVEVGTINPDAPFSEYQTRQILYNSAYYTHPTLLADSSGVLLYNQLSTPDSVSIIGYRLDVAQYPPVPLIRRNVIYVDTVHRAPWLYDLGDRKGLFWHEYTDRYRGRMLFFDGNFPLYEDIDNRISLRAMASSLSYADETLPPALLRIDSLLYIAQFANWTYNVIYNLILYSSMKVYNLNEDLLLPWERIQSSAGRFALVPENNTAVVSLFTNDCIEPAPTYCRDYYCSYEGFLWTGTAFAYIDYNEPVLGCGAPGFDAFGDHFSDIFAIQLGDEYLIWRECSLTFMKVNVDEKRFETVIDLSEASGIDFGYTFSHPYTLNPVKLDDGCAVFMINNLNPSESHLLVFDNFWNFKGHDVIPLDSTAGDFSQFEYCSQDGKIYFAYSAFQPLPYLSSRVFLQSVAIENVTDADDGEHSLPRQLSMEQNSPNPFNASTKIRFYLPRQSKVSLSIYNILGQKVTTLVDKSLPPGDHEIIWDGSDGKGKIAATGIYLYKLTTDGNERSKKMLLLK